MTSKDCNILSIAPYRIIPANSGGRAAIVNLHHHLGKLCNDHVVSAVNNDDNKYAFYLHKIFSAKPKKYIPYYGLKQLIELAKENSITHIICEHPYMAINAQAIAKKLGIPWFIRSHNIESERFRSLGKAWWPVLRQYERYAMHHSDGVFFITPEDAKWAQQHFGLPESKCHFIPFGTDQKKIPANNNIKETLGNKLSIDIKATWLYFLGALDYPPNANAVKYIVQDIAPLLDNNYEILIAGKGLPQELQDAIAQKNNMHYLGFVDDLGEFINACDIMLNPVLTGGGIKTKAVEALGHNKTVISTHSGAAGLLPEVCGDKLIITEDNNWLAFANAIAEAKIGADISTSFYDTYHHGNVAQKVLDILLNH